MECSAIKVAAALLLKADSSAVPSEGCEHLFRIRWKENASVCLLCRSVVAGPNGYTILLMEPPPPNGLAMMDPVSIVTGESL
jgi:hypothetical protein